MEASEPTLLAGARRALEETTAGAGDLLRSLPDLDLAIPGSAWTVREAAVHLITGTTLNRDIATGMASPVADLAPDRLAADNAQRVADIPESDPRILAGLLGEAVGGLLEVTAGRSGREIVVFHGGLRIPLARLVCISLGELVLHGADMATAAGRPWTVAPDHARLVAAGYAAVDEEEFSLETLKGRTSWTWL